MNFQNFSRFQSGRFACLDGSLATHVIVALFYKLDVGSQFWSSSIANLALLLNLRISLRLIISKILKAKSSLSSLPPLRYGGIVALSHGELGRAVGGFEPNLVQNRFKIQLTFCDHISRPLVGLQYIFIKIQLPKKSNASTKYIITLISKRFSLCQNDAYKLSVIL